MSGKLLDDDLAAKALLQVLKRPSILASLLPLQPPAPWHKRLEWRWRALRKRLGEIVAGERFDD